MSTPTRRVQHLAAFATVAAAFVAALILSWRKWGNVIVDCGRELELPRRLLGGERLYSDVRFFFGPLAPYVNAGLYRIFGVHLNVLVAAGVASAALLAFILWFLVRRFVRAAGATLATVAFVFICGFAQLVPNAIFNFALPYTYAATYGMLAAAASLLFLVRHVDRGRAGDFVLSTAALVLSAAAKVECAFPAALAHVGLIRFGGQFDYAAFPTVNIASNSAGLT